VPGHQILDGLCLWVAKVKGKPVFEAADDAARLGNPPARSSSGVLGLLLDPAFGVTLAAGRDSGALGSSGYGGRWPSATALFNAFVSPGRQSGDARYRQHAARFKVLCYPGEPMRDVELRPGDLLLRVALGEGWGLVAVVASSGLHRLEQLAAKRLRGEGYPLLLPGSYVHVVEIYPRRRPSDVRFARRVCDDSGALLGDTLLLRPRPAYLRGESGEAGPDDIRPASQELPLRPGSSGVAVRDCQLQLNRVHADLIALGLPGLAFCPLEPNGRFTSRMERAVRALKQQVFDDSSQWDAVIDAATKAKLDQLAGSAKRSTAVLANRPEQRFNPGAAGTAGQQQPSDWTAPTLLPSEAGRLGIDIDRAVQANRQYGTQLGWVARYGDIVALLGLSGTPSEPDFAQAVADWQGQRGLPADGMLGPNTWGAMLAVLGPAPGPAPSSAIDVNRAVQANRQYGVQLGWITRYGDIVGLLGLTGTPSESDLAQALASWQGQHALAVDGMLGPNTWGAMQPLLSSPPAPPPPAPSPLQGRINQAMQYFMSQGWTRAQAAGIVANLQAESGLNPGIQQLGGGPGYGLAQWEGPRQADFARWAGHDIHGSSFGEQLQFVQYELTHTQSPAGNALHGAQNAADAGAIVCRLYERPADIAGQSQYRAGLAQQIYASSRPGV
jgi:peptidoglycan hydrolase-like protein with peptidoglycan-binding domain